MAPEFSNHLRRLRIPLREQDLRTISTGWRFRRLRIPIRVSLASTTISIRSQDSLQPHLPHSHMERLRQALRRHQRNPRHRLLVEGHRALRSPFPLLLQGSRLPRLHQRQVVPLQVQRPPRTSPLELRAIRLGILVRCRVLMFRLSRRLSTARITARLPATPASLRIRFMGGIPLSHRSWPTISETSPCVEPISTGG